MFWLPSACKSNVCSRLRSIKCMMKPPRWVSGKESATQETWVPSLGQEAPLEEAMAAPSSVLPWRIPRTEEPGGPQSTGSQTGGHDGSNLACRHASVSCHHITATNIHSFIQNTLLLKSGSPSLSLQGVTGVTSRVTDTVRN